MTCTASLTPVPDRRRPATATDVLLVPLAAASDKIDVRQLASVLNECQTQFWFFPFKSIDAIPVPTAAPPEPGYSPHYDPDVFFSQMAIWAKTVPQSPGQVACYIVDTEVYHEMFSTIDRENTAIVISLRVSTLAAILEKSNTTLWQYVALEIGLQLLTIVYRRQVSLAADPTACAPPWHVERRNCIFDYYGISPSNVTKLQRPRITKQTVETLRDAGVSDASVVASMRIIKLAATTRLATHVHAVARDPLSTLLVGAILGLAASVISNQNPIMWIVFAMIFVALLVWRGMTIR